MKRRQHSTRYLLPRRLVTDGWRPNRTASWILFKPNETNDDEDGRAVRAAMILSRNHGYHDMHVLNLFAQRPPLSDANVESPETIEGYWTNRGVLGVSLKTRPVVFVAWGDHPAAVAESGWVADLAAERGCLLSCWGVTPSGNPVAPEDIGAHPALVPWGDTSADISRSK